MKQLKDKVKRILGQGETDIFYYEKDGDLVGNQVDKNNIFETEKFKKVFIEAGEKTGEMKRELERKVKGGEMREIKFRAWNKLKKEMFYILSLNIWDDCLLNWWEGKPYKNGYIKQIELMQYTGLKDKNGKEIYEGDIIAAYLTIGSTDDTDDIYDFIDVVSYKSCKFLCDNQADFDLDMYDTLEVRGNIYENPELLNQKEVNKIDGLENKKGNKMKKYKFLTKGLKSENGNFKWKLGEWFTYEGELGMCQSGFHCSKGIYQAFSYVQGGILTEVEVKGKHLVQDDKEVWEKMRLIKAWKWIKIDSILFSIYAAELCLKNFESVYPYDKRPRDAIEAVRKYALHPTEKNRKAVESVVWSAESAARSAVWSAESVAESAVWSAESAKSAAWSAWSAESAARSAESAARSAAGSAWSAESAARSARLAVESAVWSVAESAAKLAVWSARLAVESAESAIYKKLDKWMLNHIEELKEIK